MKTIRTNKKADVNWMIIGVILALFFLFAMLMVSSGVFSKYFGNIGIINNDLEIKTKCLPRDGDVDIDGDGFANKKITLTDSKIEVVCDEDDTNPDINYKINEEKKE